MLTGHLPATAQMRARTLLAAVLLVLPASVSAQVVEYYHLDALGNVRALTNQAGAVVERHDYMPFGEEWNPQPGTQPKRFAGKERDAETGLDYFGARYYGSKIGRFTTTDPAYVISANLVDPQLWNRYSYVRNNPLRHTDPDGRLIDTLADIVAIEYDLLDIGVTLYTGGSLESTHFKALGGDVLGAAVPFLTGVGAAIRAGSKVDDAIDAGRGGTEIVQRAMSRAEAKATEATGLVRGGRDGTHYVSDAVNSSAQRARERLALAQTPEVRVTMEVPAGSFSPPSKVAPKHGMPGGGTERTATGAVPAKVLRVDELKKK